MTKVVDKLKLAVNSAIEQYSRIARMRQNVFNSGRGIDAKRANAWCEYGFPETITFEMLYNLYSRGGIAFGTVNKLVGACWSKHPEIIEGEEYDKNKKLTQWEKELKKITDSTFWRNIEECDRRRLAGKFSALILKISDNKEWQNPVENSGVKVLTGTIPIWRSSLKPQSFYTDTKDKNYGNVKTWQYTEQSFNGSLANTIEIHADRIFIFGEWRDDTPAFLEPAYNSFVTLEKIEGGSGESFLKNAARQISVAFDKEVDLEGIARAYGVPIEQLREVFDEAARELNRGNDSLLITQGAAVSPMVTAIADPEPAFRTSLQAVSAAVDIPTKILVGMQTGERASSEDQKYFNARCQSRREKELSYELINLIKKFIAIGVLKVTENISVIWDDLRESTASEKLDNAAKMSTINKSSFDVGDKEVFDLNEIRVAAGFEPIDLTALPEGEDAIK